MGWAFWLLFVVSYIPLLAMFGVQYWVDHLGPRPAPSRGESSGPASSDSDQNSPAFLYISFAFFVAALALQAYQAIAFP